MVGIGRRRPPTPTGASRGRRARGGPEDTRTGTGPTRANLRRPRIAACACGSTVPTTAPTSPAGPPSRAAYGPGSSRPRSPPRCGCPRCGSPSPAGPTPVCTRAARSRTSTSSPGWSRPPDARAPAACALARRVDGILPPDLRVRRVVEAPEGFDARFSAVWRRYAYRIADAQELADPLVRGHVLTWGRAARPRRDERGLRAAGRPARLRRLLQAARGRHHRAHAARPRLAARRRRARRRLGPCRRLLPQHGPRPGRQPHRGGRGPATRRVAGRGDGRPPPRRRACACARPRPHAGGGRLPRRRPSWPPRPTAPEPDERRSHD